MSSTATAETITATAEAAPVSAPRRLGWAGLEGGVLSLVVWLAILVVAVWVLAQGTDTGPVRYVQSLA